MKPLRSFLASVFLSAAVVAPLIHVEPVQAQERVERQVTRYTVRSGDTLSSIARDAGVSLSVLIRLNPDVDARFLRGGRTIYIPAHAVPVAELSIDLDSYRGRLDDEVGISGSGFRPRSPLRILAGERPSRLQSIGSVRADRRGRVEVEVDLPDWARPGVPIYFALQSRDGRDRVIARPYRVVAARPRPDRNRIEVTGTMTRQGVECPTMRGDDGRTYSLLGETRGLRPGDRVSVEGRLAEMSICQQGTAIDVRRITPLD